jgi:ribose transport system substrate-binding protein
MMKKRNKVLKIWFVLFSFILAWVLGSNAIAEDISNILPPALIEDGMIVSYGPRETLERTGKEPPPLKKNTPIKVGFCPTAMDTFYDIVIAGAKTAVDELGGKAVIDLVIQAPSSQSAIAESMNIVEGWIQQNYDAICLAVANDQMMNPAYRAAAKKGIPVFHFNTPYQATVNPYFVSNVGYHQEEAGRLMGLWLVKNVGSKPTNVAVLRGLPGIHDTQRINGFNKAIEKYPNIKLIAQQPADWTRAKGQSVMENLLTAYADQIDYVWGLYDEMSLGGLAAIKGRGLEKKIKVIGYDLTEDAYDAIKNREGYYASVNTAPKEMGYNLIMAVKKYVIDGQMVPKVINSKLAVWDKTNIDRFDPNAYKYVPKE